MAVMNHSQWCGVFRNHEGAHPALWKNRQEKRSSNQECDDHGRKLHCTENHPFSVGNINVKAQERDKEKCYLLAGCLHNALIINADGRNVEALKSEGIEETDVYRATTSNSEANILACLEAKRLGVKKLLPKSKTLMIQSSRRTGSAAW